ncbi:MAG: helix-turn-helix transcriptional regulator [Acidaminococcaceae bacterium]|nr:helix-turn-helix transcriptional regulator [Acidaminococcaceae bacterium]
MIRTLRKALTKKEENSMYPNTMGQRIEFYRMRLGLSQKELAARLRIAKSTMSQYESDNRSPSDEIKLTLCELFDIRQVGLQ